jgi:hypothetical protein
MHMVTGSNHSESQSFELRFDQRKLPGQHMNRKLPGQHMNYSCVAVLGEPFVLTYLYGKYTGRLPVLISVTKTLGDSSVELSPEPVLGQITHHYHIFYIPITTISFIWTVLYLMNRSVSVALKVAFTLNITIIKESYWSIQNYNITDIYNAVILHKHTNTPLSYKQSYCYLLIILKFSWWNISYAALFPRQTSIPWCGLNFACRRKALTLLLVYSVLYIP